MRAQFGPGFRPFGDLRRRRNELEYPHHPADSASEDEARQAVEVARQLINAAKSLIGESKLRGNPGTARLMSAGVAPRLCTLAPTRGSEYGFYRVRRTGGSVPRVGRGWGEAGLAQIS